MSMNESCHQVRERVSLWLDHQLPAGERASIGAHLDVCVGCRGEFETFAALSRRVRALEPDELSDTFASEIRSLAVGPPKTVAWWQRPMASRIAAGVLVCLGLALAYHMGHESGLDEGGPSGEHVPVMGQEISHDMQTRAARSVLGDLAVIDRIPKSYQQPVLASQFKRFDLRGWTRAPQTVKDPTLSQAAIVLRQLGRAIESPGGLNHDRLLRLKAEAVQLKSSKWGFKARVRRAGAKAGVGSSRNGFFESRFGKHNSELIRQVAPGCSDQDQKALNSFLTFKECVVMEDPFGAYMVCRDIDVSSEFGSAFQVVVGQNMEDVGVQINWDDGDGARGFSFPGNKPSGLPGVTRKKLLVPESLEARLQQLFAEKLDGEVLIEESIEDEGTQSLRITIIRGDK